MTESPAPSSGVPPLLRELADVLPLELSPELPVNLVTDYRIDLLPDSKPLALSAVQDHSGGRQVVKSSAAPVSS